MAIQDKVRKNREKIVKELLEKMKEGYMPSKALWDKLQVRPQNPTSNVYYRGINRLKLSMEAVRHNYKDPRWITYIQAKKNNWNIKKGEHGTLCEKWIYTKTVTEKDENGNNTKKEIKLDRPVPNYFIVFNAEQIEGIPKLEIKEKNKSEMIKTANDFINSSECTVKEVASDQAYYSPREDQIVLPLRESFKNDESFLTTALHEMGHSTGHETRLNRNIINEFGSTEYAKEELTAELSSVFVSGDLGIKLEGENFNDHTNYLKSWIKVLENDPNELFRAAAQAEKAADRLYGNYMNYTENKKDKTLKNEYNENKEEKNTLKISAKKCSYYKDTKSSAKGEKEI